LRKVRYPTCNKKKGYCIAHILRRNYILIYFAEGETEVRLEMAGRRGKRRKELLDYLRETRGYWNFKEESLDRTV